MPARIHFEIVAMFTAGNIQPSAGGVSMNEGLEPEPIKDHSLMRLIIMCSVMLVVALLFGSVPVLFSYRKIMGT